MTNIDTGPLKNIFLEPFFKYFFYKSFIHKIVFTKIVFIRLGSARSEQKLIGFHTGKKYAPYFPEIS